MSKVTAKTPPDAAGEPSGQSEGEAEMIWLRQEPSTRLPAHSRAEITAAALEIADAEGFDQVSMRRVAESIGAGTMTLYRYVRNKDELITLMVDAVVGEALIAKHELEQEWRSALRHLALSTREAFRRHRWALDRLDDGRPLPNSLRQFEQCLRACSDLEIDEEAKYEVISLINDYISGFSLREAREIEDQERGWSPEVREFLRRELESDEYTEFRRFLGEDIDAGFEWASEIFLGEGRFERGLDRLLDGIEAEVRPGG